MHPLGINHSSGGAGRCCRIRKGEIVAGHEKDKPKFRLKRIPNTDVFEGVTTLGERVYATISSSRITGQKAHTPMRIRFLPRARRTGFPIRKAMSGKSRQLAAQLRTIDRRSAARSWPGGRRTRSASACGDFNTGTGGISRCACSGPRGLGNLSFPAWAGSALQI